MGAVVRALRVRLTLVAPVLALVGGGEGEQDGRYRWDIRENDGNVFLDRELARVELEGEPPIADALVRKDAREEATDIERGDLHEVN